MVVIALNVFRLPLDNATLSQSQQLSFQSQLLTQSSSSLSQSTSTERFIGIAVVQPLSDILQLREV
jgi:hypothetical protein